MNAHTERQPTPCQLQQANAGAYKLTPTENSLERAIAAEQRLADVARLNRDLVAALRDVREWLGDRQMETWPYMENGPFYDDRREHIAKLDAALAKVEG